MTDAILMRQVAQQLGDSMKAVQAAEHTMLRIDFQGKAGTCPVCGKVYRYRGWLWRHLIKKRHSL